MPYDNKGYKKPAKKRTMKPKRMAKKMTSHKGMLTPKKARRAKM